MLIVYNAAVSIIFIHSRTASASASASNDSVSNRLLDRCAALKPLCCFVCVCLCLCSSVCVCGSVSVSVSVCVWVSSSFPLDRGEYAAMVAWLSIASRIARTPYVLKDAEYKNKIKTEVRKRAKDRKVRKEIEKNQKQK